MIQVVPPQMVRNISAPSVGDLIMLALKFDNQEFEMSSILEVVSVTDTGGAALFKKIHKPSLNKTFEQYDRFMDFSVNFENTDLLDIKTSNNGAK